MKTFIEDKNNFIAFVKQRYNLDVDVVSREKITVAAILETTSIVTNFKVNQLKNKSRKRDLQNAKKIATALCYELLPELSLCSIGRLISKYPLDHSTVLSRLKKHNDFLQTERNYRQLYLKCKIYFVENQ